MSLNLCLLAAGVSALMLGSTAALAGDPKPAPDPFAPPAATDHTEVATFGGGCFWCLEAIFQQLEGVVKVTSGFAGGLTPHPTYHEVCTGRTGHAEVIQIVYDPNRITYEQLLQAFWDAHDPTTLNRQGPDVGTNYRSIILYHNEAQRVAALKSKEQAGLEFSAPIVTQIVPLTHFWPAEQYHQDYYRNHANAPYCTYIIRPKLEKFLEKHAKRAAAQ